MEIAGVGAVVVVVIVLLAAVAGAARRRGSDEVHSVEGYRKTLHTLQGLGPRSSAPQGRPAAPGGRPSAPSAPDTPARSAAAQRDDDAARRPVKRWSERDPAIRRPVQPPGAGSTRPLVFEDPSTGTGSQALSGSGRPRPVLAPQRPPRRLAAIGIVAVVVIAGGAAAYLVLHRGAAPATGGRSGGAPKTATTKPSVAVSPTTTTTVPARYTAVDATSTTATYVPVTSNYSLAIGATSGECWVQVTTAVGAVPLAQTLAAGGSTSLTLTGTTVIVIGAPSVVTVTVDRVPVVLPAAYQAPFTVTLAPSSAAPTPGSG